MTFPCLRSRGLLQLDDGWAASITPAARRFRGLGGGHGLLRHSNVQTGGTIRVPRQRRRPSLAIAPPWLA